MVLAHDDAAVLAGRHHHRGHTGLVALHPIAAVVEPAGIRITHNHHAAGADIRAAIMLVPDRRRDFLDIDILAFEHVFQERPAIDLARLMRRRMLHVIAPPLNQLHFGCLRRQSERNVDTRHRGQDVGDDAPAAGKPRHVVEQQRGIAHLALINVDDAADLLFGFGALDGFQLSGGCDALDPVPQILVGHCNSSRISPPSRPRCHEFPPPRQPRFSPATSTCRHGVCFVIRCDATCDDTARNIPVCSVAGRKPSVVILVSCKP